MQEALGREQFLNGLPNEKRLWVLERKPKTCVEAGELADEYEQVRKPDHSSTGEGRRNHSVKCHYCGKAGHIEECRKKKHDLEGQSSGTGIQCYNCKKFGHPAKLCPNKALMGDTQGPETNRLVKEGQVEGNRVADIMLDTGCSRTMVHKRLVSDDKMKWDEAVTIRCAHGDTVLYPLANIRIEVAGQMIQVEAAVSATLPVSVLLGTDVSQLPKLLGVEASSSICGRQKEGQYEVLVITTRAEAARKKEAGMVQREKEAQAGAKPTPLQMGEMEEGTETHPRRITRDQQRQICRAMGKPPGG